MHRISSVLFRYIGLVADLYRVSPLFRVLVFCQLGLLVLIGVGSTILKPQTVEYSFAQKTVCSSSFVLLPRLQHVSSQSYEITLKNPTSVLGYPVATKTVCVTPLNVPKENSETIATLGMVPGITKRIAIEAKTYPNVSKQLSSLSVISVSDPLVVSLTSPDNTFNYVLGANDKSVHCAATESGKKISCDITKLQLKHATRYQFSLTREFNNNVIATISSAKVETVTPIKVTASSIQNGASIYDKPHEITISFDKAVSDVSAVKFTDEAGAAITTTNKMSGNTVTILFSNELVRGKKYTLTIGSVRSSDGGSLIEPYSLAFIPAKGPKVVSVNIGASGVSLDKNIAITFDQPVQPQDLKKHISLSSGDFDSTVNGATVSVNPKNNFSKCGKFTIATDSGISSPYNISGESVWSYSSRATCLDTFSIGSSVNGRSILAYRIGSGANAILFVGGIHGNEQNSKRVMDDWITELDANPEKIPVNRSIVVIPASNPDGLVRGQRVNANNINLNRNFSANNWKADVKEPNGTILKNGGGATPLDQPESAALATYTQQLHPVMVMSYHCCGGVAVANDAGNSRATADIFATKTGYNSKNGDTIGNFFDYDTTGAYEDWLHDKLAIPLVLVELWSNTSNEFSRNKNGLWYIAQNTNF